MNRAADLLSGARHAAPSTDRKATHWPATNPVSEAFWTGVLCATAAFCAAFCLAASFGVFER